MMELKVTAASAVSVVTNTALSFVLKTVCEPFVLAPHSVPVGVRAGELPDTVSTLTSTVSPVVTVRVAQCIFRIFPARIGIIIAAAFSPAASRVNDEMVTFWLDTARLGIK
jgi:hypothetical protein